MKKIYLVLLLALTGFSASAQTYSAVGLTPEGYDWDTLINYDDTLKFVFSGLQSGAFGQAKLRVTYAGDFGDGSEYLNAFFPDFSPMTGQFGPSMYGDCSTDIDSINFNATLINSWTSTDTIYLRTSSNVDFFCSEQRVRVELIYSYCPFGTPTYANFTIPNSNTCEMYATQTLVGTPAGGTFTGTGMTGNVFNPSGLAPGSYDITYTATDGIGCTTSETKQIKIGTSPAPYDQLVCEGLPIAVSFSSPKVFSYNFNLTNGIDTAASTALPGIMQSPTTYYYANYIQPAYYMIDTILAQDSMVVDHDMLSGDDRGGILISDSNVYILGDNAVARFNLDLLNGVSINIDNDAMFNDLSTKKIYSFSNVNQDFPSSNINNSFNATHIIELDVNLVPTGISIPLAYPITIGYGNGNSTIILSGHAEMVVSDVNNVFHKLIIETGEMSNIGSHPMVQPYGSENWMDWGVLGFDGTNYHAFYRGGNYGGMVDYNFGTTDEVPLEGFDDWSDLASFTVDHESQRIYFHYEGNTFTFGGNSETLGYTFMSDSLNYLPGTASCPAPMTFTFNTVDLGSDTTVCQSIGAYVLEAGFGYESYTWNGVNNNWNVYPVTASGTIIADVVDAANCHLIDTVVVTFDPCLGLTENGTETIAVYPNPNNGTFTINAGTSVLNTIEVMDLNGKIVAQATGINTSIYQVNQQLQTGVYIVRIQSGETMKQTKVVVH